MMFSSKKKPVYVPFVVQYDSIMVQADVNGRPCVFILDTGDAVGPVFNGAVAQALALPSLGDLQVSGAGGATTNYITKATISFGGLTFKDEKGAIDTHLQGASLLGLPFFLSKTSSLKFDFETMMIQLEPK